MRELCLNQSLKSKMGNRFHRSAVPSYRGGNNWTSPRIGIYINFNKELSRSLLFLLSLYFTIYCIIVFCAKTESSPFIVLKR